MPHYQPSHMITVGPMPAGATTGIQFGADRMPPLILQPDAAAAASGMCKGDIVMQAPAPAPTSPNTQPKAQPNPTLNPNQPQPQHQPRSQP